MLLVMMNTLDIGGMQTALCMPALPNHSAEGWCSWRTDRPRQPEC
jgi:hypothetical protein